MIILSRFLHEDRYIIEKHIHPGYDCGTYLNDITLLKVDPIEQDGKFPTKHIAPIPLPCKNMNKKRKKNKKKKKKKKKLSGRKSRSHQKQKSRRASQRGRPKRRKKKKTKSKSKSKPVKLYGRCGSQVELPSILGEQIWVVLITLPKYIHFEPVL